MEDFCHRGANNIEVKPVCFAGTVSCNYVDFGSLGEWVIAETEDRGFKSHSIQQDFPKRVSCNYIDTGTLEVVNNQ